MYIYIYIYIYVFMYVVCVSHLVNFALKEAPYNPLQYPVHNDLQNMLLKSIFLYYYVCSLCQVCNKRRDSESWDACAQT